MDIMDFMGTTMDKMVLTFFHSGAHSGDHNIRDHVRSNHVRSGNHGKAQEKQTSCHSGGHSSHDHGDRSGHVQDSKDDRASLLLQP